VETNVAPDIIKMWINSPWYIQILNFIFIIAILGAVIFTIIYVINMIRIKWNSRKGLTIGTKEEEEIKLIDEVKKPVEQEPSLLNHRIFNLLTTVQMVKSLMIDENSIKGAIGATFLKKCKFPVWEKQLKEFIQDVESGKERIYTLTSKFVDIEKEYIDLAKETPVNLPNGITLSSVPQAYVEKYEKHNLAFTNIQIKNLDAILNSRYYKTWRDRAVACLDILCLIFEMSFNIAHYAIESLNGEYKKFIKTRGIIDEL
jgi:hypothetical protein